MENMKMVIANTTGIVEMIGVLIILANIVYVLPRFSRAIRKSAYVTLRQSLGKSILLGRCNDWSRYDGYYRGRACIANSHYLEHVIVLMRTVLSLLLQVEQERRFLWQGTKVPERS